MTDEVDVIMFIGSAGYWPQGRHASRPTLPPQVKTGGAPCPGGVRPWRRGTDRRTAETGHGYWPEPMVLVDVNHDMARMREGPSVRLCRS